ncbi:MAG TPA: A24 family peptidase [Dehalococcoidia bacterium]|nr:A24 family peptidase [Dehalococcoidia bacterium]
MAAPAAVAPPLRGRPLIVATGIWAALLPLCALHAKNPLHFLLLAGFSNVLVMLAVCDATTMLLPNRLTYPAALAAIALGWAWPAHSFGATIAGGLAGYAIMFALFTLVPGFGAGDVKLCGLIGLLVGWPFVLYALTAGVLCNGLVVLAGLASGKLRLRGAMPYGPGLIAGALLIMLRAH